MKIIINSVYDLNSLKKAYKDYYGLPDNYKVLKSDIANFLSNEINAFIMGVIHGNE